ncbi:MAG: hypothetical protein IJM85_00445 [Clostridia bacterium]|nr:hypothetical protein [Clostridia bacterium]
MENERDNNSENTQNKAEQPKKRGSKLRDFLFGLFFFFLLRVDMLLFSVPVWALLILHFTAGLHIRWFWIALGIYFLSGLLRYLLILFGRWGGSSEEPKKENKNPYSGL